MTPYDVIIIGAGAAGLMCAIEAGKRGRRVLVMDHAKDPGEKIRISGGGRCNFTNIHTSPRHFLSNNPHFCISALTRFTPRDFIGLIHKHGIAYHEKTRGQLFCDHSSRQVVAMLVKECQDAGVVLQLGTAVHSVSKTSTGFLLDTASGQYGSEALVVATGGLSIPKMGATGLGYDIARQFGIHCIPTRAGLVPLTVGEPLLRDVVQLAGISAPVEVRCNGAVFQEALLFTHRGLSGPAILQISSYWKEGDTIEIRFAPEHDLVAFLKDAKQHHPKQDMTQVLATLLPKRLVSTLLVKDGGQGKIAEQSDQQLVRLAEELQAWPLLPQGTEGYRTAEVTLGGVDTAELSSKTMECKKIPQLYFIGEVMDVTGHLGGFNFQWAWASGYVAGQYA